MAAPQGQLRVSRYFAALGVIIVALYALVFFTGPGGYGDKLKPKLGLDLQGGTTVTLEASTPDGKAPKPDQIELARQILENRVNGTGVAEFEVLKEGDRNIIINVPGKNNDDVKRIGEPAQLRFREMLKETPDVGAAGVVEPSRHADSVRLRLPVREAVRQRQALGHAVGQGFRLRWPGPDAHTDADGEAQRHAQRVR